MESKPVPKMQPTPPAVTKIYVKEQIAKEAPKQPIGEQVICWDPCNPPPAGPVYEGPILPYGHVAPPFAPVAGPLDPPPPDPYGAAPHPHYAAAYPHPAKTVKVRESSSAWLSESSWQRD